MELKELLEKENINIDIKELDKNKVYIFKVYFEDDTSKETIFKGLSHIKEILNELDLENFALMPICNNIKNPKDLKIFELDKEVSK
jgi:hypothetical protein